MLQIGDYVLMIRSQKTTFSYSYGFITHETEKAFGVTPVNHRSVFWFPKSAIYELDTDANTKSFKLKPSLFWNFDNNSYTRELWKRISCNYNPEIQTNS